jgi:hypothetical protein
MQNQLRISPSFFKKERNNYSNWPVAFWRELVQNSVDAGCSRIDVSVDKASGWIEFADNGSGFSKAVLSDVFFNLGETTKDSDSTIGGFGKARILTHFSHKQFEMWSQDWYCIGSGSSYDIFDHAQTRGCKVRILVDATDYSGYPVDMLEGLKRYLQFSQLSCSVYINGEKWTNWCYRNRLAKNLSCGGVYVNKSSGIMNQVIVRVHGAMMFTMSTAAEAQVVLEIDPYNSRKILVSNRDSLHSSYQNELGLFLQLLAVDTKSALRDTTKKTITYGRQPRITRRNKIIKLSCKSKVNQSELQTSTGSALVGIMQNVSSSEYSTGRWDIIDELIPSAIVLSETSNPKIKVIVNKYDPESWSEDGGGNRRKLLRQWSIICDIVIEEWLEMTGADEVSWKPGFLFADDRSACWLKDSDGVDCLLMNPVDEDGKIIFRLRDKMSWRKMLVRSSHEVTHMGCSNHNETFSSMRDGLIERVLSREEEIFKALLNSLQKD